MKNFYLALAAFLITAMAFSQGVTTSAISGKVVDETGEPLGGATVIAIHLPTGTTYGAATDFDGFYRISGMRAGGPFKITFSYVGFSEIAEEDGVRSFLIDGPDDIEDTWFDGGETILLTAGASAPETVVQQCIDHLQERFAATVETQSIRKEEVHFPLPSELPFQPPRARHVFLARSFPCLA